MNANVTQNENGQYEVTLGNLTLIQFTIDGKKFIECTENKGTYIELCSAHEARFQPMFIALHNYKISK